MQLPTPDYFAVLEAKRRTVSLRLNEGEITVGRARLRQYAELRRIIEAEGEPETKAVQYIETATGRTVDDFDPAFLLETYAKLLDLNKPIAVPAILRVSSVKGARTPHAFQYEGRWLVSLVNSLVSAGWDVRYVLEEMDPDEAWLYLQEVQYDEWQRYQGEYTLSSVGRDKHGKQRKLDPPVWTFTGYGPPPDARRVRRRRPPDIGGVVINFNDPNVAAEARKRLAR